MNRTPAPRRPQSPGRWKVTIAVVLLVVATLAFPWLGLMIGSALRGGN
jgi:hypothetical protein